MDWTFYNNMKLKCIKPAPAKSNLHGSYVLLQVYLVEVDTGHKHWINKYNFEDYK